MGRSQLTNEQARDADYAFQAELDAHTTNSGIHFLKEDISHLEISDIGTTTHSGIDDHIADSTIHFTQQISGSEFQVVTSSGVSTTTSTDFQTKASMTTTSLPDGQYRLGVSYGWNHDDTSTDFEARVQVGGSTLGEIHKQEPKDSSGSFESTGTSQRHYTARTFYLGLSGVNNITLQFRTDDSDDESSIWDAVIELWRVS